MLSDWLAETGELYVDVYHPHSAGGNVGYFIHEMQELKSLIAQETWPEIIITIFRRKHPIARYRFTGTSSEQIPDGQPYAFVSLEGSVFPSSVSFWGSGASHVEFRREFAEVLGEPIAIGQTPFDVYLDESWFFNHPDEVFHIAVLRKNWSSIRKNRDHYEPFSKEPERYQRVVESWYQEKSKGDN